MKYVKARPVVDIVREYMRNAGLETPLLQHRLIDKAWPAVVGNDVVAQTQSIRIYNEVLYVQLRSAVLRQELMMRRTEIVRQLNAYVDAFVISDMRVS